MRNAYYRAATLTCLLFSSLLALGQETAADRVSVPFRDPSRPGWVKASSSRGSISVKGYEGKDVIAEAQLRKVHSENQEKPKRTLDGLRRIDTSATGLMAEEEDNVILVNVDPKGRAADLVIQAPPKASLRLSCMNGGRLLVENVEGEVEANNLNGAVTLNNVSGVVRAHTLNGDVTVNLRRVTSDKPMSFSTLNGDIDVTLPADTKATLQMETQRGSIDSDFDIQMNANARDPMVEDGRKGGGRYKVAIERARFGSINGGGPEFKFKTQNGNIHIRKGL